MFAPRLLLIIGVLCISSVICKKKLCNFDDSKCLTKAARLVFKQVISGIQGVESSDPLYKDFIDVNFTNLKYKLFDGYLSGMLDCKVELFMITNEDQYDYHLGCPKLTLKSDYEMMASDGTQFVKSSGNCLIDLFNPHFHFNGVFDLNEDDKGMHIKLTTHNLLFKRENVTYQYFDQYNVDTNKTEAFKQYASENWKSVVKHILQPIMESFMKKHIKNKNAYLAIVPIKDLFYSEE